jgi:nitroreductase
MFMELLDIMNERFSVRKYVDKPVEPEKLDKILNAADWQHLLLPISSL